MWPSPAAFSNIAAVAARSLRPSTGPVIADGSGSGWALATACSHRIGNPNPGIRLRALHGWNREAGTTSDLGL